MSKINEYPQAVTVNNNDLFVIDQESGGNHTTKSARVSQIVDKAISGVQTQIGDPNGNISDSYDPAAAYVKGDLCIYENVLYICTAPTTGTFDPSKWTATTIDNVIGDLSALTTSDKSSLVGAVNEVDGKVNVIGAIVQGSSTGGSAVFTRTWAAKASITLTKGVWIINTRVLLQQDNNGYRALNVAKTSGESTPQCTSPAVNGNLTALNMSVMQRVTSESMTFYLNGVHNSTQNSELSMVSWYLNAVRIA